MAKPSANQTFFGPGQLPRMIAAIGSATLCATTERSGERALSSSGTSALPRVIDALASNSVSVEDRMSSHASNPEHGETLPSRCINSIRWPLGISCQSRSRCCRRRPYDRS